MRSEELSCYLFISPAILFLLFLAVGPMIASLVISFTYWDIMTPPRWIGLENYREMFFEDERFWKSLWNTLYFTLFVVPAGVTIPFLAAMLLNTRVAMRGLYRTAFYLPSIVPVVAGSVLWLWLLNPEYGLVNGVLGFFRLAGPEWMFSPQWSKPAIIIMTIWGIAGGPSMLIFLAGLQGVPSSLYEAADIDGAGQATKFWNITIPMMSPYLLFTLIMGFITSLQVFTQAYVMSIRGDGGPVDSTLFYVLYLYHKAFRQYDMGYASAMAWFLFLIILVITVIQFRFLSKRVHYG
jgi:multiple sugar transport system permease protein